MRLNEILEVIISVLLATLGGMARMLNVKDDRTVTLSRMFSELFVAAFIGSMMFLLAKEIHTESQYLMWLLAGTAGWVGPKILNLLPPLLGKVNIDFKDPEDQEKK
ncbi:MAG: phage holin family protein [Firmicutes bacterium]|nr:phage holin family protein [Bacillota bacterium]